MKQQKINISISSFTFDVFFSMIQHLLYSLGGFSILLHASLYIELRKMFTALPTLEGVTAEFSVAQ